MKPTSTEPHFPFEAGPRKYQEDAYNSWVARGYEGIFAMATGTGKTVTSLNCVLQEYRKSPELYAILILVPTLTLVDQWKGELEKFGFSDIHEISGNTEWRTEITLLKNQLISGLKKSFAVVSTYASFVDATAFSLLEQLDRSTKSQTNTNRR